VSALVAEAIPPRPDTPRGVEAVLRRAAKGDWIYRFRTRWKDPVTGRRTPAEFDTIAEAEDFRALLRFRRARGDVARVTRADRSIDRFVQVEYWPRYARFNLAPSTISSNQSVYRRHISPHVGGIRLRRFDAAAGAKLRDMLQEAGVGDPTVRRALVILQGVFTHAIDIGIPLERNPIRDVRKPGVTRQLTINAPGPWQIEAVRRELDPMSAALVSLIAYEGLRPSEALGLEERHLQSATLIVEQRAIGGAIVAGLKTSHGNERHSRSPKLYQAVRGDIEAHLAELTAGRSRRRLLFPGAAGGPWSTGEYRRWRETVFAPAVQRAGVDVGRVYDLRHGCASLLLHAGWPLERISKHMGHTISTLSTYYAHVIDDLREHAAPSVDVEQQITTARQPREAAHAR
jgi:integrase